MDDAINAMPRSETLGYPVFQVVGATLVIFGITLVLSSFFALGITGTFLGDYCGILMEERVTGFPFNITDNPMYDGSTLNFIGLALWYAHSSLHTCCGNGHSLYKEAEPGWVIFQSCCLSGLPDRVAV